MSRTTLVRWCVVTVLLLAAAAVLFDVVRDPLPLASHVEIPSDELLAYDLAPPGSVVIGLSGKASELLISSWCVVGQALPEQRFVYGVVAEWLGASADVLGRSELAFESRVSGQVDGTDASHWSVRLAYSTDAVTDSRTLRLVIPEFGGQRPSRVKLSATPGALGRVLVRTTFPEARGELEREAVEHALTPEERAELDRDRTSLPFDELAPAFRAEALSHWQRRLDAAGSLGKDYQVTRLLIGRGRGELVLPERVPEVLRPGQALALNLFGAVPVELSGPPGAALSFPDGQGGPRELVRLDALGRLALDAGHEGVASTLVVRNEGDLDLALSATLRRQDAAAAIGGAEPSGSERALLRPLWLRSSYYRLDPEQPVVIDIPPGQDILGVAARGTPAQLQGVLRATFGSVDSRAPIELVASEFEHWSDGTVATDPAELFLQLPAGVSRVELRGDATLLVAPFTYDPEVLEDRLAGPFQRPLAPGTEFRYASYDVQRRSSLRGADHEALVRSGRTLELWAQARVVPDAVLPPRPEMALQPPGNPVTRHIVEPVLRQGPRPQRDSIWVALDRPRRVRIGDDGPNGPGATLRYRIAPEHLGQPLSLDVDGAPALVETPVTTSADVRVPLPAGDHSLALRGLGSGDSALVRVSDAPREPLVRQRIVYRLLPAQSFELSLDKTALVARLIVLAYAEGLPFVALSHAIDGDVSRELVATTTPLRGRLEGPAVPAGTLWFWESRQAGLLRTFKGSIRLGEDLRPGRVRVTLRNESRGTLWLALVLVGQSKDRPERLDRFWALEEP